MGMVKHRRMRLSTDGMSTKIRSFKCSAEHTCISGGPQGNISGGENTRTGQDSVCGGGGDGDDDSMEDDEDEDEVLEEDNGWGQEEEEE